MYLILLENTKLTFVIFFDIFTQVSFSKSLKSNAIIFLVYLTLFQNYLIKNQTAENGLNVKEFFKISRIYRI